MAISEKYKMLLAWAGIGGALSLFLAHPPPEQHPFVDRLAYRAVGFFVWAFLGAVAAIVVSFFRRPSEPSAKPEPSTLREAVAANPAPAEEATAHQFTHTKADPSEKFRWLLLALNLAAIVFALALSVKVLAKNPSTAAFGFFFIAPFALAIVSSRPSSSNFLAKTTVISNIGCGLLFFGGLVLGSIQDPIFSIFLAGVALSLLCALNIKAFWRRAFYKGKV